MKHGRVVTVLAIMLAATTGCTTTMKYRLAGVDPQVRRNLERGESALTAKEYRAAVTSLNRAVWDLEGVDKRSLRLGELARAYEALARANTGLASTDVAEEHRRLALAMADAIPREPSASPAQRLAEGKKAYRSAQFVEAIRALRQALIELQDVPFAEVRIIHLVETRCYLAFSYFAAQDQRRVHDELSRVWAHDASMRVCRRDAPPGVRSMILEIQRRMDS